MLPMSVLRQTTCWHHSHCSRAWGRWAIPAKSFS